METNETKFLESQQLFDKNSSRDKGADPLKESFSINIENKLGASGSGYGSTVTSQAQQPVQPQFNQS